MKEKLLNYLKLKTLQMDWNKLENFTLSSIAIEINEPKALLTSVVNDLNKNNLIVKIKNKPVYYLHKEMLEKKFHTSCLNSTYDSVESIKQYLKVKEPGIFSQLIGSRGTLRYCLEQCKAAVMYPGNGLPVLLHGESGTGKSNLANLMFKYAKQKKVINEDAQMMTINCAEYANNPELFLTNLFGHVKGAFTDAVGEKNGILSICDGGYLFLDEVHCLSAECQEKIFLFMDKGIYHKVGDNEHWHSSQVRMIFATTENPNDVLLKTLLRRIVLIINLPSLEKFSAREKREFLYQFILDESTRINKEVSISKNAMQAILQHKFYGNVGELKNVIRAAVANAYLIQQGDITIHTSKLPINFLNSSYLPLNNNSKETNIVSLEELCLFTVSNYQFNKLNEYILKTFNDCIDNQDMEHFWEKIYPRLERFVDYLFFDKNKNQQIDSKLTESIENIFYLIYQRYYGHQLTHIQFEILTRIILEMNEVSDAFIVFQDENQSQLDKMLQYFQHNYSDEYNICYEFVRMTHQSVLFERLDIHFIDFIVFLHYFGRHQNNETTVAVIIAHGYSIASGIAEVANHMLQQKVFDALDMSFDLDVKHIANKLIQFLQNRKLSDEILIMVDMGSLEDIHRYLEEKFEVNIGIINNVNTRLVLDVGNRLRLKEPLESVLEESSAANKCRYLYSKNKKRRDIILSVCETGRGSAQVIANLIEISMPKNKDILILPYDIGSLQNIDKNSKQLEKYNVIAIVGTKNPHLDICPFISLEDLIYRQYSDKIAQLFNMNITKEEIEEFKKNIIKNFSYQQITNFLEFIQPKKIIQDVEDIIECLQDELHTKFKSGTILLLYIHISCLVERLIMNKYLDKYENLEAFEKEHGDFIKIVYKAFKYIEKAYNVKIPISEIAYIYDCLYKDNYQNSSTMNNMSINLFNEFDN